MKTNLTMQRHLWTLQPTRRLRITGKLHMLSALHIGGGASSTSATDAGVLRHRDGRPFIPGSSLKGVLRSHLERLSQPLPGVYSCMLYDEAHATACPTPGWIQKSNDATTATEADFQNLCHTCTLFGSPILAGKVRIPDLEIDETTYGGEIEIRDGVGIDRDRGTAVEGIKYDFEVVQSGTIFDLVIDVESPDDLELGLIAVAIRELQHGHVSIGGKTTRGLGMCRLEDVTLYYLDYRDTNQLKQYLLSRDLTPLADPEAFLTDAIERLFATQTE